LVETDCPYLAPVPFRGKRCDSTMLPRTVAVLADSLAVSVEKLVDSTWKNACDVYEISPSFR
jgi:TatD DNase family protein